jgi:hypothetical protein
VLVPGRRVRLKQASLSFRGGGYNGSRKQLQGCEGGSDLSKVNIGYQGSRAISPTKGAKSFRWKVLGFSGNQGLINVTLAVSRCFHGALTLVRQSHQPHRHGLSPTT